MDVSRNEFHISTFSGGGGCVAVALLPGGGAVVRHSRFDGPVIEFNRREWDAFVKGVKANEFELRD